MNRTIRNLVVAAPLATIALTLVPVGAATAGPNGPNVIAIPKGGNDPHPGPKDIAIPKPKPKGPKDIAIPEPKPKGPQDKAPKPAAKPQAPEAAPAPASNVDADSAVVVSAKGSPDSIDRSDDLFAGAETELVAQESEGGIDLTWLLVGGGVITASGVAFAARKRSNA